MSKHNKKAQKSTSFNDTNMRKSHVHKNEDVKLYNRRRDRKNKQQLRDDLYG